MNHQKNALYTLKFISDNEQRLSHLQYVFIDENGRFNTGWESFKSKIYLKLLEGRPLCLEYENGEYCFNEVRYPQRTCNPCKNTRYRCFFGIDTVNWNLCFECEQRGLCNALSYYNYYAYGAPSLRKSGISEKPINRLMQEGVNLYAIIKLPDQFKSNLDKQVLCYGNFLPVVCIIEYLIPIILMVDRPVSLFSDDYLRKFLRFSLGFSILSRRNVIQQCKYIIEGLTDNKIANFQAECDNVAKHFSTSLASIKTQSDAWTFFLEKGVKFLEQEREIGPNNEKTEGKIMEKIEVFKKLILKMKNSKIIKEFDIRTPFEILRLSKLEIQDPIQYSQLNPSHKKLLSFLEKDPWVEYIRGYKEKIIKGNIFFHIGRFLGVKQEEKNVIYYIERGFKGREFTLIKSQEKGPKQRQLEVYYGAK